MPFKWMFKFKKIRKMKKLEVKKLEVLIGGYASPWCYLASGFFPPIALGCAMKNIDSWFN